MITVIIMNGASSRQFHIGDFRGAVWGCNFAYQDWPLTHCVAVDRMAVAAIRGQPQSGTVSCEWITRESPLELPPGWREAPAPGIDSGSMALSQAILLGWPCLVLGADGIMGGDTATQYHYAWHSHVTRSQHQRHREACVSVCQQARVSVSWAWPHPDPTFDTVPFAQAQTWIDKYSIPEDHTWPSPLLSNATPKAHI